MDEETFDASLNCTFMELKAHTQFMCNNARLGLNCTFMELKDACWLGIGHRDVRLNCTFMELKDKFQAIHKGIAEALIVPLWN